MNYENDKNRICICTSGSVRQRCNCANRRLACLGVRLCDDAKFDGEFESTGTAWPIFMTMLKRSAEAGVGSCTNATTFRFLDIPLAEAWHRLIADKQFCDALVGGTIRHFHPRGCYCIDFANKMLSVFAENCAGKTALTVTWLLYAQTDASTPTPGVIAGDN